MKNFLLFIGFTAIIVLQVVLLFELRTQELSTAVEHSPGRLDNSQELFSEPVAVSSMPGISREDVREIVAEALEKDREAHADDYKEVLAEYHQSPEFEQLLWSLTYSFILDLSNPENRKVLHEQMQAAEQTYREEQIRLNPSQAVTNNLRQLASAAEQYFLEYGKTSVTYAELEGEYFKELVPVNGEVYRFMTISTDMKEISVVMQNGEKVSINF